MSQFKQYLGDSVYADFDGVYLVLTTENGFGVINEILLEPEVVLAFERYRFWLKEQVSNPPVGIQPQQTIVNYEQPSERNGGK